MTFNDRQYYIDLFNKEYELAKKEYLKDYPNGEFESGKMDIDTVDLIVGYYLVYYGDNALNEWNINNTDDIVWPTDEGVTNILNELFVA